MRRDWYIALCDVSGEYEGNPPSFDAATIFGPYTADQALKISEASAGFPHATYVVRIFDADGRPTFRNMVKLIEGMVESEQASERQRQKDMEIQVQYIRGG